jgi:hypothetical protein
MTQIALSNCQSLNVHRCVAYEKTYNGEPPKQVSFAVCQDNRYLAIEPLAPNLAHQVRAADIPGGAVGAHYIAKDFQQVEHSLYRQQNREQRRSK